MSVQPGEFCRCGTSHKIKPILNFCDMLWRQNFAATTIISLTFSCSHKEICRCDVLQRFVAKGVPTYRTLYSLVEYSNDYVFDIIAQCQNYIAGCSKNYFV
jgi:hypothetical protein